MTIDTTNQTPQTDEEWIDLTRSLDRDLVKREQAWEDYRQWKREQRTRWTPDGVTVVAHEDAWADAHPEAATYSRSCNGCLRYGVAKHELRYGLGSNLSTTARLCDDCLSEIVKQAQERLA